MALAPRQEITDLKSAPGELSFEARIGERAERIWFRTESELTPNADAALATCLTPAMRNGDTLRMIDPISPRILRNQREFQAIQAAWSQRWDFGEQPLREVEVEAPERPLDSAPPTGRVAAFFSGGVDSFSTVFENPDLTDLIFVRGFDLMLGAPQHAGLLDEVDARLRETAGALGMPLHVVETNLRDLSDGLVAWDYYFGAATTAVALFMAPLFDRVLITGDSDYEVQQKFGANWLVDQLWSTERLEICDVGGRLSRMQRVERIAFEPAVQQALRVCWENRGGAYNCGRCRKCLMTMIALEAIGAREQISTFPAELDLGAVSEIEISQPVLLTLWEDLLDASRRGRRRDLERATETVVEHGRQALGLPSDYRRRRSPGPPPVLAGADGGQRFLATPATAEALASASAVAVLVGSYDGSGNYGDLLQLDGARELLAPHAEGLLVLPVVERALAGDHGDLVEDFVHPFEHALYFDPGEGGSDGLVPVRAPQDLSFACLYLYGGGYLNPAWGERKLTMLQAAEQLLGEGGAKVRRVASGLQVDRDWFAGLGSEDKAMLKRFDPLGARDEGSREALAELANGAETFNGGDDAVGILRRLPVADRKGQNGRVRVNLHFAEHAWISDQPDSLLPSYLAFLGELSRRPEQVVLQPLVAYSDPRIDEGPALARLLEACAEFGIEVDEPILLRPAGLADAAPQLGDAALTLSCSYHVALTSLMLGVPAVLHEENAYYRQKAEGLRHAFGAEPAFAAVTGAVAEQAAGRIVGAALDGGAQLREQLAGRAAELGGRHLEAETRLLDGLRLAQHREFGARAEIAALRCEPGELSFEARIGGEERRVWFRTESELTPNADAALAACLMPAMRNGGRLRMTDPVSPRILRNQREFQAIQVAWSREWNFGVPPLKEVELEAPERPLDPAPASGRVAAFFSGGVDSFATVLENPDLTDLIFVRGVDLIPGVPEHQGLVDEVEQRMRAAAAELGMPLHVVATNVRELSDPLAPWEAYNSCALVAVALFMAPLFDRVLIASDSDHATQLPLGAGRMIDQLWNTERLEIVDACGRLGREQRLQRIAGHPVVQRDLRVCWQNPDGAYNCGRCRKCVLTMIGLEAIGARAEVSSFPAELDLDLLADFEMTQPIQLIYWEGLLESIRDNRRADLEQAVAPLVERGKRALGLPQSYRVREDGPPAAKPLNSSAADAKAEALSKALREAEDRAEAAAARAEAAERSDAEARQMLAVVLGSSSWRLTAPLRRLSGIARRWRHRA
ncbi:MAG TPA: polysaccharide pyruvyl transferase family protein [Solirubrobacterales bacterium]